MKKVFFLFLSFNFFTSFSQDGTLDNSFGSNGIELGTDINVLGRLVEVQSTGKIVTCATYYNVGTGISDLIIQGFNANGSPDNSFAITGNFTSNFNNRGIYQLGDMTIQADDKILVSGTIDDPTYTNYKAFVLRLNTDGTLDNTFGNNGIFESNFAGLTIYTEIFRTEIEDILFQPDGKIVVSGSALGSSQSGKNLFVFRLNADGTIDSGFNSNGVILIFFFDLSSAYLTAQKTELLSNGKYMIYSNDVNYTAKIVMFKVNSNGTMDTSFGPDGGKEIVFNPTGYTTILNAYTQSDGKMFIVLNEDTDAFKYRFLRVNSNGNLDNTYGTNGITTYLPSLSFYTQYTKTLFQDDGKIVISNALVDFSQVQDFYLMRFNYTGTLDPTFGNNGIVETDINANSGDASFDICLQSDNKIVAVGESYDASMGYSYLTLARYNGSCSAPTAPVYSVSNPSLCANTSNIISLTAGQGANVDSYTWTLPSGWSGNSTSNVMNLTTNSTSGNVSVVANNSCGTSQATIIPFSIVTNPPQIPSIITGNTFVCASSVSNIYSVTNSSDASNYNWTLPNGWSGSSNTNTITTSAGTNGGTISVVAQNACGNSPARTLTISIINGVPSAPTSIIGNTVVCTNSPASFSVALVPNADSYTWTKPSGWTGSSTSESVTFNTNNQGGTITVKANNGCGSSPITSLTVSAVNPMPAPASISGNQTICSGSSNTYTAASVNGASVYTWTLPNGWTGTSNTTIINTISSNVSGTITVAANNECGAGNTRSFNVTAVNIPSAPGTISGDISICKDSATTYSISSVNGATSYTWTLPTNWIGSSSVQSIATVAGNSGVISVTADNMCGSSSSANLSITVYDNPAHPVITKSGNILFCDVSAFDYQWYVNGVAIPGANNQTYQITGDGNYSVAAFNQIGCFASSYFGFQVGINENEKSFFSLAPNPTNGKFAIIFNHQLNDATIEILDASGKVVYNFLSINGKELNLDLKLTDGFYFCKISEGTASSIVKFIKE